VRIACGSTLLPRRRSERQALDVLDFHPAVPSASDVVNGVCDPLGRRIRAGSILAAGVVVIATGWFARRRSLLALGGSGAVILFVTGLPHLFSAAG